MTTLKPSEMQIKLTKEQKQAVGILSLGTFLEYFDLMLYVHMAVLLNELFFPKTDPHMAQLLAATTFCATYVFRPFGALLFGWIGDTIGRKHTIIITTIMMALCCVIMASASTYAEIGITAAYVMMSCRIVQGLSSMGEVVGALVYLTECIHRPARYQAVAWIPFFCGLGGTVALGIATLSTMCNFEDNWRVVFWAGAIVAGIGIVARTVLRETPDFLDAAKRLKIIKEEEKNENVEVKKVQKEDKTKFKSLVALFLMECVWPLCFYFVFIFCADLLKSKFNYTSSQVIAQNFIVNVFTLVGCLIKVYMCGRMHPLVVVKYTLIGTVMSTIITLICLNYYCNSGIQLGILQALIVFIAADIKCSVSAIYPHFPTLNRFKVASFVYALSRALMYVITSFGMIYLVDLMGYFGIFVGMITVSIGCAYGLRHFMELERKEGYLQD